MSYSLTLQDISTVTHDTRCLRFDRPEGFAFEPGQAAEIALDRDGWRDEGRPFTMTSQPEDPFLEFVIKIYPDHDGVTEQIATMTPGEKVQAGDPFGAITDHGAGTFIAGGAGVTPFICLLRRRAAQAQTDGCHLIFSNKSEADIILRDEWERTDGLKTTFVVTDEDADGLPGGPIDRDFLDRHLSSKSGPFYICGPGGMVDDIRDHLKSMGVDGAEIITEDGW
ncbi:FAD-binding oxidoreductase [Rhodophyticola porphyridii]|uniref:Flavodoxin reductase n=1 Tax=Rhodophyticola porphyridii TaxID=1852017 RepID=A0A3L9YA99_9RHOB|nr:FAD-binding oxidoreductase [Rhodophyticola porphyridii]RMA43163.1 flavodoxin reductase [Rhodophyticola porphyridii]